MIKDYKNEHLRDGLTDYQVLYKADFQSYYDKVKSLFKRFSGGF